MSEAIHHPLTGSTHTADFPCEDCDAESSLANLGRLMDEGELGRAWQEAEAALPEGWALTLTHAVRGIGTPPSYYATARAIYEDGQIVQIPDPTPAAALRALAARLRERAG